MAFILKITDGVKNVDFMGTSYHLADGGLEIKVPKKKQVWSGESSYSDGAQLVASKFENRKITIKFEVTGSTRNALLANISTIEALCEGARQRSINQTGKRVEFQYQWENTTNITYFEIIDGLLQWPKDTMSVTQVHQQENNKYVIYNFQLTLIVSPFGYSVSPVNGSPVELALTNGNGTDQTGGLKIWNHDDAGAGHDNWVEIDGDDIKGELAATVKLKLKSDTGEAEKNSKIYIGVRKGNLNFVHILEDNVASFVIGSPSPTNDPDYSSGGTYTSFDFSGTTEQALIRWALTNAQMEATQGAFRFFGRCHQGDHWDQNANYCIAVKYGSDILFQSEWRKPNDTITELFDFGTIYLPPWLVGTPTALAGLNIEIRGKRDISGTTTIKLDYLALLPQDGGYRVLDFRAVGFAQLEYLVDDGWSDVVYHINTSSKKTGLPYGLMAKITLQPGVNQRIYMFQEGTSKNCEITRQLIVQVFAVPVYNVLA